jgi:hypothetical protein
MKLNGSKHASNDQSQFKTKQAKMKQVACHSWMKPSWKKAYLQMIKSILNPTLQVEASRKQAYCL